MRLKDSDTLTWASVTADLIQVWNQIQSSGKSAGAGLSSVPHTIHSENPKRKAKKGGKKQHGSKETCDFCGKENHKAEDCYLNPDSDACKLPQKARDLIRAMNAKAENQPQEKKKRRFGGSAQVSTSEDQKKTGNRVKSCKADPPILDSGATITMF